MPLMSQLLLLFYHLCRNDGDAYGGGDKDDESALFCISSTE